MFTDREKHGFGALLCQRPEYGWRIAGPRTVVEGVSWAVADWRRSVPVFALYVSTV